MARNPVGDDLRSFLDQVRQHRPRDIIEVDYEVDPKFEITATIAKLEQRQRSPIIVFNNIRGSDYSVAVNICGSNGRIAYALNCPLKEISTRYAQAIQHPIKPVVVSQAAVQQHIFVDADIDLYRLPQLVHHEHDADKPYLTAAIGVARDPDTGQANLSFHRLMVVGPNNTGILIEPGKDLDRIYQKYCRLGRAMPIAFFIGAHPLWSLGALYSGPLQEYDIIGGLLQAPLSTTACVTQSELHVPAGAEIVLEGAVAVGERIDEGPFGEWPGFSTGVTQTPVFNVTAITTRDQPVFQDIVSGHTEHLILEVPAIEYRALKNAQAVVPGVTAVSLIAPLTSVVSLKKSADAEPKKIMNALLKTDIQAKHLIVVDDDIAFNDLREVFRAIALNTQADRDVYIYPDEQGTPLDPSCEDANARTSKMGIDATRRMQPSRRILPNSIPAAVLDSIDINALLKSGV